jgi:hypothetical protein
MQERPQATAGPVRGADFPDPLAPLKGLPALAFERLSEIPPPTASVTQDALGQDEAKGDNPARNTRPKVNTHVHLPPNFSAFGAVE